MMLFRDSSLLLLHLFIVLNCLPGSPFSYVHARIFGRINFGYSAFLNCLQLTGLHLQWSTVSPFSFRFIMPPKPTVRSRNPAARAIQAASTSEPS